MSTSDKTAREIITNFNVDCIKKICLVKFRGVIAMEEVSNSTINFNFHLKVISF